MSEEFYTAQLSIPIDNLYEAIAEVESKSLKILMQGYMDKQAYIDAAIYFYKRKILRFDVNELAQFVIQNEDFSEALKKSYIANLLNDNPVPVSMFAIKKRMVEYV